MKRLLAVLALAGPRGLRADLPGEDLMYWQAFRREGNPTFSARHQQFRAEKEMPSIETIIQYKPGWARRHVEPDEHPPGDGVNIVGIKPAAHRAGAVRGPVQ